MCYERVCHERVCDERLSQKGYRSLSQLPPATKKQLVDSHLWPHQNDPNRSVLFLVIKKIRPQRCSWKWLRKRLFRRRRIHPGGGRGCVSGVQRVLEGDWKGA